MSGTLPDSMAGLIPCSATKDVCDSGQATYPYSTDEGAERLILSIQPLHQALQSSKFFTCISLVIIQSRTQINDQSREMPEHSSFPILYAKN